MQKSCKENKPQIEQSTTYLQMKKKWNMVRDVEVHFIDNFQHAAIDVKIEMGIHKGPAEALLTPKKLPDWDPLRRNNAEE